MDIKLEELPAEALALFRTQPGAARPTEGDAFVYSQGGHSVSDFRCRADAALRITTTYATMHS